jgi:hypothetical protein
MIGNPSGKGGRSVPGKLFSGRFVQYNRENNERQRKTEWLLRLRSYSIGRHGWISARTLLL